MSNKWPTEHRRLREVSRADKFKHLKPAPGKMKIRHTNTDNEQDIQTLSKKSVSSLLYRKNLRATSNLNSDPIIILDIDCSEEPRPSSVSSLIDLTES